MPLFSFLSLCLQALNSFVSVEHTLFLGFLVFRCLKAYFVSMYVTQWIFLLLCISLTELALELCSTYTHTNPLTVVNTCAMLRNTRKATLKRIGTQRKKRGYKGGTSYTYAKVRRCQNTQLAMMSMEVESKD